MARQKPVPLPNIDMGATYKIIDDSVMPPKWKTIGQGFAASGDVQRVMRQHSLQGIWVFDTCGDSYYVSKTVA